MNLKSAICAVSMLAVAGIAQAFPSYTVYPENVGTLNSTQMLSNIQFTFSGAYNIIIDEEARPFLQNEEGDDVLCINIRDFSAMQTGTVAFFFEASEIKTNGSWTIVVPEGTLTIDGEENPELTASWTLDDPDLGIGEYPQITLESITPAEGSKLRTWGGSLSAVYLTTSDDSAVNYIGWSLNDITDGEDQFVTQGSETRYDFNRYGHNNDNWTTGLFFSIGGESKLVEGHTYRLDLRLCGIGYNRETNQYPNPLQIEQSTELVTSVFYEGLTPPQQYAEAVYLSVSPDPATHIWDDADNSVFEITYSAPAKPTRFFYSLGEGRSADAGEWYVSEGETPTEDGLATKWSFKFFPEVVAAASGTLISNVVSMDNDGLYVRGNSDYDFDNIYYQMVWLCNAGAPSLVSVDPLDKAVVESLSSITISNGINGKAYPMTISNVTYDLPQILTKDGGVMRTLQNISYNDDGTQATWSFDPITENGAYVLMIPYQYFSFGAEADGFLSNSAYFEYYVENNGSDVGVVYDLMPATVSPENGSTIGVLGTVTLTFDNVTNIHMDGSGPSASLYKVIGGEDVFVEEADPFDNPDSDWFNPTIYDFFFSRIYDDGEYKIVIPEGMFFDNTYAESDGVSGSVNPEFVLSYIVDAVDAAEYNIEPVSIYPEDNAELEELSTVTLTFPETVFVYQDVSDFNASFSEAFLYRVNEEGEEMVQSVVPFDNPASDYMNPTIYDLNFATVAEKGIYKVVVPQGLFGTLDYLESKGHAGNASKEIIIYYVVDNTVGVDAILDGQKSVSIYDVNGVEVAKDADAAVAKALKSGIYVINGKKVIIRR